MGRYRKKNNIKYRGRRQSAPVSDVKNEQNKQIEKSVDLAYYWGPTTREEDWYWNTYGTTGTQEDFWWRRLTDVWYQRDVIPSVYLEIQNHIWEAYRGNPLVMLLLSKLRHLY